MVNVVQPKYTLFIPVEGAGCNLYLRPVSASECSRTADIGKKVLYLSNESGKIYGCSNLLDALKLRHGSEATINVVGREAFTTGALLEVDQALSDAVVKEVVDAEEKLNKRACAQPVFVVILLEHFPVIDCSITTIEVAFAKTLVDAVDHLLKVVQEQISEEARLSKEQAKKKMLQEEIYLKERLTRERLMDDVAAREVTPPGS